MKSNRRFCASILVSISATACSGNRNVTPDSRDFPIENPDAHHEIRILGEIAPEFEVSFTAYWEATNTESIRCRYYLGLYARYAGLVDYLNVSNPLSMSRSGKSYQAKVVADKYLPGFCRWSLRNVTYQIYTNGTLDSHGLVLLHPDEPLRPSGGRFGDSDSFKQEKGPLTMVCSQQPNWMTKRPTWYCKPNGTTQHALVGITQELRELNADFVRAQ